MSSIKPIPIGVDFDGTCVTHEYPDVGADIGAEPVLHRLVSAGHQLVLFTMRSGRELADAVQWFHDRDLPLHGVNHNPDQSSWTSSPKAYAKIYIDDAALGCPLIHKSSAARRPFVDWLEVESKLEDLGVLPSNG